MFNVATASGNGVGGDGGSTLGRRARIGYLIMLSGVEELRKTKRLLKVHYHSTTRSTNVNRSWCRGVRIVSCTLNIEGKTNE